MSTAVAGNDLKIGVGVIDKDHRELLGALSELETAVVEDEERAVVGQLLQQLAKRTIVHFASEEGLMAASKYQGRSLHVLKHQYLTEQMESLVKRFERGSFNLNEHTLVFLRDWLTTHIQKEDRQFGLWLNEHGVR